VHRIELRYLQDGELLDVPTTHLDVDYQDLFLRRVQQATQNIALLFHIHQLVGQSRSSAPHFYKSNSLNTTPLIQPSLFNDQRLRLPIWL
jgi:hypothetical protein